MESVINLDGAGLLFPTSFGYFDPYILKEAVKYPKVTFEHAGGLWTEKDPKNIGSYFGYIFEAQFINGIVAGHASSRTSSALLPPSPFRKSCRTSTPSPWARGSPIRVASPT